MWFKGTRRRSRTRTCAVGEPGDVPDVGQDPCCDDGPDVVDLHQAGAAGEHERPELRGGRPDLGLDRDPLGQLPRGDPAAGSPAMSRCRTVTSIAFA
jgi:hypothetical protein